MRYLLLLTAIVLAGCQSKTTLHQKLEGDYFVIYPEEELASEKERKIYAAIQDSIVGLKGLKLISLLKDGTFIQWDSTISQGQWAIMDDKILVVSKGGKGFTNFTPPIRSFDKDVLKLQEVMDVNGEKIVLVWHLKKIMDGKAKDLFGPASNSWRQKPSKPETDAELKNRLAVIMKYYANYFKLISEESSYFMPRRVMLPVRFYQHAIGMKEFEDNNSFVTLFYSTEQARKAYDFLKKVINDSDYNNPGLDSYSKEYAYMLEKLAIEIVK